MRTTGDRSAGRTGVRAFFTPRPDVSPEGVDVEEHEVPAGPPLVLVVDDAADFRALVRFELEHARFRVEEAASGEEALETVHRCHPDVLLLDLTMPDVDGWDVLKALRGGGCPSGMRVAVLTGECDEMVEQRARSAGASMYLAKPISGSDLVRALRRLSAPQAAAAGVA